MTKQKNHLEKDLQDIYEEAPIGLCSLDTNLRYIHINDWLAALNGLPVEAHLGRTLREVLPDVAAGAEHQLREVIETGEPLSRSRLPEARRREGTQTMAKAHILVVEDEGIVAKDIQERLKRLGYAVPAVVSSGEEALRQAAATPPDLVLMDIRLQGEMDGVEAAEHLRTRFQVPVVYLTAFADEPTLQCAKATEPFGYLLKPFDERELHTVLEIALYKHQMERKLRVSERWLAAILTSIGDAVMSTDTKGCVTFMNPVAEALTDWKQEEAVGKALTDVFQVIEEDTRTLAEDPVTKLLRGGALV